MQFWGCTGCVTRHGARICPNSNSDFKTSTFQLFCSQWNHTYVYNIPLLRFHRDRDELFWQIPLDSLSPSHHEFSEKVENQIRLHKPKLTLKFLIILLSPHNFFGLSSTLNVSWVLKSVTNSWDLEYSIPPNFVTQLDHLASNFFSLKNSRQSWKNRYEFPDF